MLRVRPSRLSGSGSYKENRRSRPPVCGGLFLSPTMADDMMSRFGQIDNIEDNSDEQEDVPASRMPINIEGSPVLSRRHGKEKKPKKQKNELPEGRVNTFGEAYLPPSHFRRKQPPRRRPINVGSRMVLPPVNRNSVGDIFLPPPNVDRLSRRLSFIAGPEPATDSDSTPSSRILEEEIDNIYDFNRTSRTASQYITESEHRQPVPPRRNSDDRPSNDEDSVRLTVS